MSCLLDRESKEIECNIKNWLNVVFIYKILERGDILTIKTVRNIFVWKNGRKVKVGRKEGIIDLKVEKVSLDKSKNSIRVKGVIVNGPEEFERGYHSVDITIGKKVRIRKNRWDEKIERLSKLFSEKNITTDYRKYLEEFFSHFNKNDGMVSYGNDVKEISTYGIIKAILIPDDNLFDEKVISLVDNVVKRGGVVVLVPVKTEEGLKFKKNFGLAALLRFSYNASNITS